MPDMNFSQQDDIFDPTLARPVTVVGAGSVGSQLVINLAKLGCTDITVWDPDFVSSHNIPMSAYRQLKDIARPKVDALAEIVEEAAFVDLKTHRAKYTGQPLKGAVVSCVDWMDERKVIWEQTCRNPLVPLLVDTRIANEFISVFAIRPCDPEDIKYYEHFMYPSAEAVRPMCGEHGARYISGTAANAACAALTEWWKSATTKRHLKMLCGHFQEV